MHVLISDQTKALFQFHDNIVACKLLLLSMIRTMLLIPTKLLPNLEDKAWSFLYFLLVCATVNLDTYKQDIPRPERTG